ncbi:hypothetical protein M8J75_014934 [Diaphorina citri]|nr:hypothetical protein M8J75_014934 [Diaphorina citri]
MMTDEITITIPLGDISYNNFDIIDFILCNTGAELIYSTLKLVNIDLLRTGEAVQKFFDHNIKEKLRQLNRIVNAGEEEDDKTGVSSRDEDPDWFTGLETNARTKEAFMFKRSQERIRGYLYKSRSDIRKSSPYESDEHIRFIIESIFSEFSSLLKQDDCLGRYFDRSHEEALCDKRGEFLCRGAWNRESCDRLTLHRINPYQSREARIVFSTIERSRSIIPSILEASSLLATNQRPSSHFNHAYFYRLLFTTANLKLVHIVCHDKGEHKTAKCDPKQYFVDEPLNQSEENGDRKDLHGASKRKVNGGLTGRDKGEVLDNGNGFSGRNKGKVLNNGKS